jgi:hypothetical protein
MEKAGLTENFSLFLGKMPDKSGEKDNKKVLDLPLHKEEKRV